MTLNDLRGRSRRLEALGLGLAKEVTIVRPGNDPMLRAERQEYLAQIQDALAGVEKARVVLAKAIHRLEGSPGSVG